jgi:glycosyltransferase involved in cell wall biosynthesis
MNKPLISIIIPFYNVELYLFDCLNSILDQTYTNFELIMINDGSTDTSLFIANKFKINNPELKITIIDQENHGQAFSRNVGMKFSKGEYISFVDSDDLIEPTMLQEMIETMIIYDLDVVNCSYLNFYNNPKLNYISSLNTRYNKILFEGKDYFKLKPSVSPCDKLYKAQFLRDFQFGFLEGYYAEDVLAISHIYFFAKKTMYLDRILYKYRRNSTNSTRNSKENLPKRIKLSLDKLTICFHLHNFSKTYNWKGYNQLLITRNILGVIFTKYIFNFNYKSKVLEKLKKLNIFNIFLYNFRIYFIFDFVMIIIEKLFTSKNL